MAIGRIGYRRLYDAVGCSLADQDEFSLTFAVGDQLHAEVYLGPRPKFGIQFSSSSSRYLFPGGIVTTHSEFQREPSTTPYAGHLFLEVACWKEVKVATKSREKSRKSLMAMVQQEMAGFGSTIDLLAGTVGLRFHQQFVLELVSENPLVLYEGDDFDVSLAGPSIRVLTRVVLNETGKQILTQLVKAIGAEAPEARESAANALGWLLRAWAMNDLISRFLMLFIAIEFVLDGIAGSLGGGVQDRAEEIRKLIRAGAGPKQQEVLQFFNQLVGHQRPSLTSRFEEVAKTARLSGWEHDVAAFKKFNKMRNNLLHQGEPVVSIQVSVSTDEVRDFQDLVERYVCYRVFGDAQVYSDDWLRRPVTQVPDEPQADEAGPTSPS